MIVRVCIIFNRASFHFITFISKSWQMEKVGRRSFLQLTMAGIVLLFGFVWDRLIMDHLDLKKGKIRILPFNKNKSVSFADDYVIIHRAEKTTVFSAHCTHLGCIINQTRNGRLVCPCHGSEYNLEGMPVKGPAYKSLEVIPSKITPDGNHIEISG